MKPDHEYEPMPAILLLDKERLLPRRCGICGRYEWEHFKITDVKTS